MKILGSLLIVLLAASCGQPEKPQLIKRESVVFIPADKFFYCPNPVDLPDPDTLTDTQIATLLVMMDTNNRICKKSVVSIHKQLLRAKQQLENNN